MQTGDSRESSIWILFLVLALLVLGGGGFAFYSTVRAKEQAIRAQQQAQQQQTVTAMRNLQVFRTSPQGPSVRYPLPANGKRWKVLDRSVAVSIANSGRADVAEPRSAEFRLIQLTPGPPQIVASGQGQRSVLPVSASGVFQVLAWREGLVGVSETIDARAPATAEAEEPVGSTEPSAEMIDFSGEESEQPTFTAPPIVLRPGIEVSGDAPRGVASVHVRFLGVDLDSTNAPFLRGAQVGSDGTYRIRGIPSVGTVELVDPATGRAFRTIVDGE